MATIKKSAKSSPKMTRPVVPAKKGAPKPKMAPMPSPMMEKGGDVKKYQKGGNVPKGMVKGESGKLYSKSDMDSWQTKQAAALTKQAASTQKGAVKKTMKSGGKMKKCC